MNTKSQRTRLSLKDKVKIIDECNKGVSLKEISIKFRVPKLLIKLINQPLT